jgi:hypothetical protein
MQPGGSFRPRYGRCASSGSHLSGLFLPQRDPDNSCVLDARE